MKRHCAALPLVDDLDPEPEQVAELALEHLKVGVHRLGGVARAGAANVRARAGARLFASRAGFGLAHGQAFRNDLTRQFLRIRRGRHGPRMAHTDIAFQ